MELDMGKHPAFRQALAEAAGSAACSSLVIDLSQADFVDASSIRLLQETRAALQAEGRTLVLDLTGPRNRGARRLLEITGLTDYFFVVSETQPLAVYDNPRPEPSEGVRPYLRVIQGERASGE
jgi:anti-anti-sigma factor